MIMQYGFIVAIHTLRCLCLLLKCKVMDKRVSRYRVGTKGDDDGNKSGLKRAT
jgi:hypothetical protein